MSCQWQVRNGEYSLRNGVLKIDEQGNVVRDGNGKTILCEFHIVQNEVYHIPTLFMAGTYLDGSYVAFDALNVFHQGQMQNIPLQPMEHPRLGGFYYSFHPCFIVDHLQHVQEEDRMEVWLTLLVGYQKDNILFTSQGLTK